MLTLGIYYPLPRRKTRDRAFRWSSLRPPATQREGCGDFRERYQPVLEHPAGKHRYRIPLPNQGS